MRQSTIAIKKTVNLILLTSILIVLFASCYSVRFVNKDGVFEPDPTNQSDGFYKGMMVHELDTTISLKLLEGQFHLIERCPSGAFYSFEYRVTFGGVLLSAITFGKKRQVKIKYVCSKQSN